MLRPAATKGPAGIPELPVTTALPVRRAVMVVALAVTSLAHAHGATETASGFPWAPVLPLLVGLAYALGLRRLWGRAGTGRGVTRAAAASFLAGAAVLAVALAPPLDPLADRLFSAHMLQHVLLTLVAAPLLALGAGGYVLSFTLPLRARRGAYRAWRATGGQRLLRVLGAPLVALVVHAAVFWVWHAPRLYEAALLSPALHALEHLTMLGTAVLFWVAALRPLGRGGVPRAAQALYLFLAALQGGALGALITLSPRLLYPLYAGGGGAFGLTPLEDQQLAGLIMWVPTGVVYASLAAYLTATWLYASDETLDYGRRG